jgi:taurine dioxygenase
MIQATPSGQGLGARVDNIDLSQPLSQEQYKTIEGLLGKYGVLWFSKQTLTSAQLSRFSSTFGTLEINVANMYQDPSIPEVMILSNK